MEIERPRVALMHAVNMKIDIHIVLRFSRKYIIGKYASYIIIREWIAQIL